MHDTQVAEARTPRLSSRPDTVGVTPENHGPAPARELTPRALAVGLGIGALLTIGNVYMGLKTGYWDSGSITATVVGFALLTEISRRRGKPYSVFENNITQTTAASAAAMPAAIGLLGAFPALELLGRHYSPWLIAGFGLLLAVFGILLSIPFRERFVVSDPLPFPTATATAELIRAIHAVSGEARGRLRALSAGAAFAAAVTWFRDAAPALLPAAVWFPVTLAGCPAATLTLGVGVSPMLLGAGMLVGARTGFSLLAGSLLAWAVLAPLLVRANVAQAEYSALVAWLVWPGVALTTASGLLSLALQWRVFARALAGMRELGRARGQIGGLGALGLTTALLIGVLWLMFGVHPLLGTGIALASVVLVVVCVRTAGETDMMPLGPLGQLVQLLLGLIAPGAVGANVACASLTGAAAQSTLTVSAFKTGHLLGASARAQFFAQLVGAVGGALVALPAYALVKAAYGLGTQTLPAPGALPWKALAELAATGSASLPPWCGTACLTAVALGVLLTCLERTRWSRFCPSPIALSAAFFVPATISVAVGCGALAYLVLRRRGSASAEQTLSSVAAGGIAGESLVGVLVAVLSALGALR